MNIAVVNVKTDPQVKEEARKLAQELGISLSSIMNAYLRQFVRTKSVYFNIAPEMPNAKTAAILEEAEKDRKAGFVSPAFDKTEDAITWLNDSNAKYENQVRAKV